MSTCEACPPEANCPGPDWKTFPDDMRGHFDGTDGAHPAWWRGHAHTADVLARQVLEVLKEPMKYMRECHEESITWHHARVAIATMALNVGCLRADMSAITSAHFDETAVLRAELERTKTELAEAKRALAVFSAAVAREVRRTQ